jgi:hypothetical protein
MDASRLPVCQSLPCVEALLESFMLDCDYVARGMDRVVDRSALPIALSRIAGRHQRPLCTWGAWTDERRTLFVTARMLPSATKKRGRPILRIRFYDQDGRRMCVAAWMLGREGAWELCAVGPAFYRLRAAGGDRQRIIDADLRQVDSCSFGVDRANLVPQEWIADALCS